MIGVSRIGLRRYACAILWGGVLGLLPASAIEAGVISYQSLPTDGVFQTDAIDSSAFEDDPGLARFWEFTGSQGTELTIRVERLEDGFEPFLWIFAGTFSDTVQFAGGLSSPFEAIDTSDAGFLHFASDGLPPSTGGSGFDVQFAFSLPMPGIATYTAIVSSLAAGADDGGDGLFSYRINADASSSPPATVPEPASLVIFGLIAMVVARAPGLR